jgi:hypothetical protein
LSNLEQIAVAGGTEHAYLVEGGDVAQTVLSALRAIRGDTIDRCVLELPKTPAGGALNPDRVNVVHASSACEGAVIQRVDAVATCNDTGGWYYDDPNNPAVVHLCPATCDEVLNQGGQIFFSVGCTTIVDPA